MPASCTAALSARYVFTSHSSGRQAPRPKSRRSKLEGVPRPKLAMVFQCPERHLDFRTVGPELGRGPREVGERHDLGRVGLTRSPGSSPIPFRRWRPACCTTVGTGRDVDPARSRGPDAGGLGDDLDDPVLHRRADTRRRTRDPPRPGGNGARRAPQREATSRYPSWLARCNPALPAPGRMMPFTASPRPTRFDRLPLLRQAASERPHAFVVEEWRVVLRRVGGIGVVAARSLLSAVVQAVFARIIVRDAVAEGSRIVARDRAPSSGS